MGMFDIDPSGFSLSGVSTAVQPSYSFNVPSFNVPTLPELPAYTGGFIDPAIRTALGASAAPNINTGAGVAGGWDFSSLGRVAQAALPIANLGLAGLGVYSGIQGSRQLAEQGAIAKRGQALQEEMARTTAAGAAPLTRFGTDTLTAAAAGKLPEAMEGQIQNWIQGAKAKMHDYLARIGQGDSQTLQQIDSEIERQAQDMRATALAQQEQLGIGALSSGAQATSSAAGAGGQIAQGANLQGQNLTNLIAEANKALAAMLGSTA